MVTACSHGGLVCLALTVRMANFSGLRGGSAVGWNTWWIRGFNFPFKIIANDLLAGNTVRVGWKVENFWWLLIWNRRVVWRFWQGYLGQGWLLGAEVRSQVIYLMNFLIFASCLDTRYILPEQLSIGHIIIKKIFKVLNVYIAFPNINTHV